MGTNDTTLLAEHKGNHFNSHMLMMFKQDEDKAVEAGLFGRTPNLGDVRRVDIDKACAGAKQTVPALPGRLVPDMSQ